VGCVSSVAEDSAVVPKYLDPRSWWVIKVHVLVGPGAADRILNVAIDQLAKSRFLAWALGIVYAVYRSQGMGNWRVGARDQLAKHQHGYETRQHKVELSPFLTSGDCQCMLIAIDRLSNRCGRSRIAASVWFRRRARAPRCRGVRPRTRRARCAGIRTLLEIDSTMPTEQEAVQRGRQSPATSKVGKSPCSSQKAR